MRHNISNLTASLYFCESSFFNSFLQYLWSIACSWNLITFWFVFAIIEFVVTVPSSQFPEEKLQGQSSTLIGSVFGSLRRVRTEEVQSFIYWMFVLSYVSCDMSWLRSPRWTTLPSLVILCKKNTAASMQTQRHYFTKIAPPLSAWQGSTVPRCCASHLTSVRSKIPKGRAEHTLQGQENSFACTHLRQRCHAKTKWVLNLTSSINYFRWWFFLWNNLNMKDSFKKLLKVLSHVLKIRLIQPLSSYRPTNACQLSVSLEPWWGKQLRIRSWKDSNLNAEEIWVLQQRCQIKRSCEHQPLISPSAIKRGLFSGWHFLSVTF